MTDLLIQVLIYMVSTFILGLLLGWAIWRHGSAEERKALTLEVKFWKHRLEQARLERDGDIETINTLPHKPVSLPKRLAATGS